MRMIAHSTHQAAKIPGTIPGIVSRKPGIGGFADSPQMNVLPNSVANARPDPAGCSLPAPKASGELPMGIRAEDLVPVAAGGGPPFDIAVVEPLAAPVRSGP